jgi:uncharacterized SAM-binding protein YcdF (DUF218 family)
MYFVLSKFGGVFLNLGTLLALLILGSSAAALAGRRRAMVIFLASAAMIILLFGILPAAAWLALPLETRFPDQPPLPEHVDGIILLGGTERVDATVAWRQPMLSDGTPVAALIALSRRYPEAKVVFSGGFHSSAGPGFGEADVVRDFISEVGGIPQKIIYEERSRNTWENASFSHALVKPGPSERWILICQAIAMPRAIGVFRHFGWNVIPYPAGYLTAGPKQRLIAFDVLTGLSIASTALHEWVGLLVYRAMGHISEVFPR